MHTHVCLPCYCSPGCTQCVTVCTSVQLKHCPNGGPQHLPKPCLNPHCQHTQGCTVCLLCYLASRKPKRIPNTGTVCSVCCQGGPYPGNLCALCAQGVYLCTQCTCRRVR